MVINKTKLEEIVLELKKRKKTNEFLMDIARNNLKYAIRYKNFIEGELYQVRYMYNYMSKLYKKAVWRNPRLILR